MTNKLSIGILVNEDGKIAAWESRMLQDLEKARNLSIKFIKTTAREKSAVPFVYMLFCAFENFWFKKRYAFKTISAFSEFKKISIEESNDSNPPDILFITCNAERPANLWGRLGNWEIIWGDVGNLDRHPPAFWEVMHHEPVTGAMLVVNSSTTKNICVYYGTTATVPYSVRNNLNNITWKAGSYFTFRLNELLSIGEEMFFKKYTDNVILNTALAYPSNWQMTRLFFQNTFNYIKSKFKSKANSFTILYSFQSYEPGKLDLSDFKLLPAIKDGFRADPFIIAHKGRNYVFFEEFLNEKDRGHISVMEISPNAEYSNPAIVLEKTYHLSYPFIFEFSGDFYMIPETSSNRTVELYRAKNFPYEWEFVKNLIEDVILIDATILFEKNKWWLFANTQSHPDTSTNDQLMLYYSDDLISGQWISHPQNPVATLISNCRPAGKLFKQNGKLYRPAQNNGSFQYGYGITINEIEIINENEYKEKIVDQLLPSEKNGISALHSLNFTDNLVVIDGIPRNKKKKGI